MEHTKGEIRVSSSNPESIYVLKNGRPDGLFATCDAGDYAHSQKEGYANAKELVRRWNAFEKDGLVDKLKTACKEAQKAIFLLYECNKDVEIALGSAIQLKKAEKVIEAAIAKAT